MQTNETIYQVKIFRCSNEHYWHHNKIGETFEVTESGDYKEWALADGSGRHIAKADCEAIVWRLPA